MKIVYLVFLTCSFQMMEDLYMKKIQKLYFFTKEGQKLNAHGSKYD